MDTSFTTGIEKDINLDGYNYLLHDGQYYRGCRRCGGSGHYSFNGFDSICYECGNSSARYGVCVGSLEDATKDAAKRKAAFDARQRKRDREAQKRVDKMVAKQEALKASNPAVYEFMMAIDDNDGDYSADGSYWIENKNKERSSFLVSLHENLTFPANCDKPFSANMIAAVEKVMESRAAKAAVDASKPAIIEGRVVFTGKVVSTKAIEGDYGTAYKMLVEDAEGRRVFGSIPGNIWDEVEFLGAYRKLAWNETDGVMKKIVGMELTFTATIEASKDDKSFGFFKRPAKASIVEGAE